MLLIVVAHILELVVAGLSLQGGICGAGHDARGQIVGEGETAKFYNVFSRFNLGKVFIFTSKVQNVSLLRDCRTVRGKLPQAQPGIADFVELWMELWNLVGGGLGEYLGLDRLFLVSDPWQLDGQFLTEGSCQLVMPASSLPIVLLFSGHFGFCAFLVA